MSLLTRKLILKSKDGETFEVEVAVTSLWESVFENTDSITLPNVKGSLLAKVIDYYNHARTPSVAGVDLKAELNELEAEIANLDFSILADLLMAVNCLSIAGLPGIISQAIANNMKNKKPDDVRRIFNHRK